MGWLDKLLGLDAATAWALAILLAFGVIGGLVFLLYKMIAARGNGKGNGTATVQHALKLDDRVDVLEHQMEQVKTGLGFIKESVGELGKTTGRLDKEVAVLSDRVNTLLNHLS